MDVGPFVVANAEASELIEPGKRPLHDPAPPAEVIPVRRAALRDKRENSTGSQSVADRRRIVAAITEHAGWTTARSASFALQWGNRIDQGQGSCESFRLAPVRRTASGAPCPSQIRCRLLPRLARSVGLGPVCVHRPAANRASVANRSFPEPQPGSCGNICQGIPLRSTKKIPVRHTRSETRGLPPFGRGG